MPFEELEDGTFLSRTQAISKGFSPMKKFKLCTTTMGINPLDGRVASPLHPSAKADGN